jgi:hypothetical protein
MVQFAKELGYSAGGRRLRHFLSGGTCCQMQKSTARKFHGVPPGDNKTIPIPVLLNEVAISASGPKRQFAALQRFGRCPWNTGPWADGISTAIPPGMQRTEWSKKLPSPPLAWSARLSA